MLRRSLAALVVISALALWPAAPAAAHGGPVVLDAAGDGATGVTVRATYKQDGHPVDNQVLRLVLNATGEGGRTVGPVQLNPANEGRGFYTTGAVLTPGTWTIVVTSPEPNPGRAEVTVEARAAQTAPPAAAPPGDPSGDDGGWRWWVAGAALLLGVIAVIALTARRSAAVRNGQSHDGGSPR